MDEHITKWLDAYYDGELRGRRLAQVENHLAWCGQCQADLDSLDNLSRILQNEPGPLDLMPAERFVTQVELQLPREQAAPSWQRRMRNRRIPLVPIVLAGLWIVVQVIIAVSGLVAQLGLDLRLFATASDCAIAFNQQAALQFVTCSAGVLTRQVLVWAIGLLYASWLAIWWVNETRQSETFRNGQ